MARHGVWSPLPMWVGGTQKWHPGHNGRRLTAVVIHRMEGYLEGTDSYFRREYNWNRSLRLRASTHFGIGNWNGRPQTRQWVDTNDTAWGWNARPNDVPTAVAQRTLTNLYNGREDLNWQVISVEVEGFAHQPWNPRWVPNLKSLMAFLYRAHGNLTIMVHTDTSLKGCPGLPAFKAGLPGWYGNKLANVVSGYTAPTTTTTTSAFTIRAGGLPVTFTNRSNWHATIKANKPRRSGATLASPNYGNTDRDGERLELYGEVKGQDFGAGSRWFFGPQWIGGKWRVVYIPLIDLTNRNF